MLLQGVGGVDILMTTRVSWRHNVNTGGQMKSKEMSVLLASKVKQAKRLYKKSGLKAGEWAAYRRLERADKRKKIGDAAFRLERCLEKRRQRMRARLASK